MAFVVSDHIPQFTYETSWGNFAQFAKQNATDFLQVDQQHLQLMDTFLQLFYLLWTWTADMMWMYDDVCGSNCTWIYVRMVYNW